ncbi:hypothetical protein [Belnapia sp. F-4-1]|uniref:hypothetical protein n=1 Tax=Belnapia sp. F-4-1 TaxID=1545443 RepID=UPI0011850FFD|nr:hypothetical protein [Belnapia sp. F-4-1]
MFEIVENGCGVICAISLMVPGDLSERWCYKPADQFKSFARIRRQIEAIALIKIRITLMIGPTC